MLVKVTNDFVLIKDIVDKIIETKQCKIENTNLSFYEPDMKMFLYCGIYPFLDDVKIPISNLKKTIESNEYEITIKSRYFPQNIAVVKMNLEEANPNNDEKDFISKKSRRAKERKIGKVIESVFFWRKLQNKKNLSLNNAADIIGLPKKSLDDYLKIIK